MSPPAARGPTRNPEEGSARRGAGNPGRLAGWPGRARPAVTQPQFDFRYHIGAVARSGWGRGLGPERAPPAGTAVDLTKLKPGSHVAPPPGRLTRSPPRPPARVCT